MWLGQLDDVVVGVAAGTAVEAAGAAVIGRVAEFCYVEPEARGGRGGPRPRGGPASRWFAARGCTDVDAMALPGDRSSKQLLESAGFKARLLILHRSD